MFDDEQRDILWNLYFDLRDNGRVELTRTEMDAWATYLSREKMEEDKLQSTIRHIMRERDPSEASSLVERVDELEKVVRQLCDVLFNKHHI